MNTNYLMQFPGDIFLHIAKYLEKPNLHTIQQVDKSLNTRIKEMFSTLYILPEGYSMGGHYEIFIKDTINLETYAQTIKENKLSHAVIDLSRCTEENFPRVVLDGTTSIDVISLKILFKMDWFSKALYPTFLERFKSLKNLYLTPVVPEDEHEKTLGTVKSISKTIQDNLFTIQQKASIGDIIFDFPGHKLRANNELYTLLYPNGLPKAAFRSSLQERTPTEHSTELQMTLLDAKERSWNHSKTMGPEGFSGIEHLSIDYSQNMSTYNTMSELDSMIINAYGMIQGSTGMCPDLKRISLTPSFFGIPTIEREMHELELFIQQASLRRLEIVLDPSILYHQIGENKEALQAQIEALQRTYGVFIRMEINYRHAIPESEYDVSRRTYDTPERSYTVYERAEAISERRCAIIAPPETIDDEYGLELIKKFSENPQNVSFQLHGADICILNTFLGEYQSVEEISLKFYNANHAVPYEDIQLLYQEVLTLLTKFPNVQKLHLIPGSFGNDIDVEIFPLYDTMSLILAVLPNIQLTFCPTKREYVTEFEQAENPRYTIDYSHIA